MKEKPRKVASIAIDGVIFERFPMQMPEVFKRIFTPSKYNLSFTPRFAQAPQERWPQEEINPKQEKEALSYGKRRVRNGAREFLIGLSNEDFEIVGNTERHNDSSMINVTKARLSMGDVSSFFKKIRFRLDGISPNESKYWFFKTLEEKGIKFCHYDDDAQFIRQMATLFPNDEFVIVENLTSGLLFSRKEMKEYRNVKRVSIRSHKPK